MLGWLGRGTVLITGLDHSVAWEGVEEWGRRIGKEKTGEAELGRRGFLAWVGSEATKLVYRRE